MINMSSFLIGGLIMILCYLLILRYLRNQKLPPGPIIPPVMTLRQAKYPHLGFAKLAKVYGDIFSCSFGSILVVVSSHSMIKEIFRKDEASKRFVHPVIASRGSTEKLGIFWNNDQSWVDMRGFASKNLREFGLGRKRTSLKNLNTEGDELVTFLKSKVLGNKGQLTLNGTEFQVFSINTIWGAVGGFRFDPDDKSFQKTVDFGDEIVSLMAHSRIINIFPFLKDWLPELSGYNKLIAIFKDYANFLEDMVKNAAKNYMDEYKDEESFLEKFLSKISKESNSSPHFTMENLTIVLSDLFLAGTETINNTTLYTIVYLSTNPRVQQKARAEILEKIPDMQHDNLLYQLRSMTYLKSLILEVFRKACFLPCAIPRDITHDIHYKNYIIPKGCLVMYNLYPIFYDETTWGDPYVFRPERFLNAEGEIIQEKEELITSIFGFGKRVCLGEALAWDVLLTFVYKLLLNFHFHPIPGQEPTDEDSVNGLTLKPQPFSVNVTLL